MALGVDTEFGGHTKLNLTAQTYPADSVLRDQFGGESLDTGGELRLQLKLQSGGWSFNSDYQLAVLFGEAIAAPNDKRRFFDLTSTLDDSSESALVHRLDRLWIGHSTEKTVLRFGRQALSWGNGFFYAPMDLVNPFNPAAIDTEYKAGDDMLYGQYLFDDGSDVQAAYVIRRDSGSGQRTAAVATTAVKYHGFAGVGEFDLLLAKHYGDLVAGIGVNLGAGGASLGGDLVVTETDLDTRVQAAVNLSYSWIAFKRNMSGTVEYYFNGFGQHDQAYDPASLLQNPDLSSRLDRGESYAAGRHYLAASVLAEMTPLWTVSPTLLLNIGDPSALLQVITNVSLSDNMSLLASLNIPLGPSGSEFAGPDAGVPGRYLSRDTGVFAQLVWYF
tara:strand:+ start:515 stop:1678 length:1164 start_codon:yes stop_codon:yes gene_type:complete